MGHSSVGPTPMTHLFGNVILSYAFTALTCSYMIHLHAIAAQSKEGGEAPALLPLVHLIVCIGSPVDESWKETITKAQ